jgi:hypothetical protein
MKAPLRTVYLVFKTHFDNGFTGLAEEVQADLAGKLIPRALEAVDASAGFGDGHRFSWTLPAWPLENALRRLGNTAAGRRLERAVVEGRITWHGLPFTTHTEYFGLEEYIRGFLPVRRMMKRFGRKAIAAKMTDVPGHTRILPTILAGAGVSFLHLGCNACSTPPDVPLLFDWEGPDGSRVATMYSKGGYGSSVLPPPGWELPIWLALMHTADNVGPQRAQAILDAVAEVEAASPGTEVIVGGLDDFAAALATLKPELPVLRSDLADSWIHGIASMPAELGKARRLRNRLAATESRAALDEINEIGEIDEIGGIGEIGGSGGLSASRPGRAEAAIASAGEAVREAWESLLLFGEHTWGLDTKLALNPPEMGGRVYDKARLAALIAAGGFSRLRRSWADKAAFVGQAAEALAALEAGLSQGRKAMGGPAGTSSLSIRNHYLWDWSGFVNLGIPAGRARVSSAGRELPTLARHGELWADPGTLAPLHELHVEVKRGGPRLEEGEGGGSESPPMPPLARQADGRAILENGLIRVEVDPETGSIVSFIDLRSGREWVDGGAGAGFGSWRYDVFGRSEITGYLRAYAYDLEAWYVADNGKPEYPRIPHLSFGVGRAEVTVENDGVSGSVTVAWTQDEESAKAFGNAWTVWRRVTLVRGKPWLDLEYSLEGKEATPLLEAGHVVFPIAASHPRYALNKTGFVLDPAQDIEVDANRLMLCCERWIDVEDGGAGLLVMPFDSPLVSIGSIAVERFDGRATPGPPLLYFNAFNNQWGTNFPQWIEGPLSFGFRLAPHAGDWREARAWRLAAEAYQPPACLPAAKASGPNSVPGLLGARVEGADLETLVWKRAEDGKGWILRLHDPTGLPGARRLRLSPAPASVQVCDLLEESATSIQFEREGSEGIVDLDLRPFEIVSLRLTY